jgi:hypothetical protein
VSKETYSSVLASSKQLLIVMQYETASKAQEQCQKRPTLVSKETYSSVLASSKQLLIVMQYETASKAQEQCQKRPTLVSKGPTLVRRHYGDATGAMPRIL